MVFAIEEINRQGHLLPNLTLGYKIYDSCSTTFRALRAAMALVNGRGPGEEAASCSSAVPVVIGDGGSTLSLVVARFLGVLRLPQVNSLCYYAPVSLMLVFACDAGVLSSPTPGELLLQLCLPE